MSRLVFRLDPHEVEFVAIRAQGAGGQNVNKVSSAVMLRLDLRTSSLPEALRQRLLRRADQRISRDGVIVIKAQEHRSQAHNRAAAMQRLLELLDTAAQLPRPRVATGPTRAARERRLQAKAHRAGIKALRGSA